MPAKTLRVQLAEDPTVGAGNVLSNLVTRGADLDAPTLTFDSAVDDHPAWKTFNLAELDRAVATRAGWLRAHGIRARDVVVVYANIAADHVLSFLALTRLGAIPALVNGNLDAETAATYIRRLQATGVLTGEGYRERLLPHEPGAPFLAECAELGSGEPSTGAVQYRHHPDDPISITHSSGTTGVPKAVVHSNATLFAWVRARLKLPRAGGIERILSALPAAHVATVISMNLALCNHTELMPLSRQAGGAVLDAIERWQPSAVFGFSTTWADFASADLATRDLTSVQLWWNTGDCAHEPHIRRLLEFGHHRVATSNGVARQAGSRFIDGLGTSEVGGSPFFITHRRDTSMYGRCIGRPHTHVKVAVLGSDGSELPAGEVGQLGVRADSLCLGYWNDSVSTYRSRLAGYLLTGDLVYRDEEGFYYHLDRSTDAIELGDGTKIYTAMYEERVLSSCPELADCTVIAVSDDGQAVVDIRVKLGPGADPDVDRTDAILAAVGERVAAVVRRVVVVADTDIPTGPTGKVRKVALRACATKPLPEASIG